MVRAKDPGFLDVYYNLLYMFPEFFCHFHDAVRNYASFYRSRLLEKLEKT